jgi:hypothetical protein
MDKVRVPDYDSTVIFGHRVNFFDDTDVHYMSSFLDWEDFKNNPSRKDVFIEKIQGYSERKFSSDDWNEDIPDCLYTSKNYGSNDNLIIVLSQENWLQEELFFVPASVLAHRKDIDILVLKEEIKSNKKPLEHNMILGINDEYNSFEKLCNLLRQKYIKETYKNIILVAGGEMLPIGLALAHDFSDLIKHAFLYDGITNYSFHDSKFIHLCHNMSLKSEYLYKKTGRVDREKELIKTTNDAFFILKAGYFLRHKIHRRITTPFRFVAEHPNLNVEYHYWKDNIHIDWLRKIDKDCENFTMHNVKRDNPPAYVFQKTLPIFMHKIFG